jgi:hypothetical protein
LTTAWWSFGKNAWCTRQKRGAVIMLHSGDVVAPQDERHGVCVRVAKLVVPPNSVSIRRAITVVSNEVGELTWENIKVGKADVQDEDERPVVVAGQGLTI